ncbi:MAG: (2Fe-2S)-binding protein [Bacillota bacterium]
MEEDTIVCRCEDLTLADIRSVLQRGYTSLEEIKRITRCCMGPCQGRTCRDLVVKEIARSSGKKIEDIGLTVFRPPVKPIKIKCLLGVWEHE